MDEIDLTDGNDKGRHVQPQGFVPSHLAEPMLRDRDARTTALEYIATSLGEVRVAAAVLATPVEDDEDPALRTRLAAFASTELGRAQRLVKALAVGALALLIVGGVTLTGGGRAEAMEAPQPDPVAQTVRVVLGAAPVTVWVRASVYTLTARGWWCASLWTAAQGRIGGTCSIASSFPIPVTIDPRSFAVGRTFAQVVDDASDTAVANVTFDARRPSRFLAGTWQDRGQGQEFIAAPVQLYSPAAGRWVAQQASPVYVRVAGRHGWVTVATLTTNRHGVASGVVHLGGGVHTVRVERPDGRVGNVWGTVGTTRRIVTSTEPLDVD